MFRIGAVVLTVVSRRRAQVNRLLCKVTSTDAVFQYLGSFLCP